MNVLIVEDDAGLARSLAQTVERLRGHARTAASLAAARTLMATSHVDLVLLDLSLPDGDGLGLLDEWRRARNPVPVIILSARGEVRQRVAGLERGADDYLAKPFALTELMARIQAVVRRSNADSTRLDVGTLTIDPLARAVSVGGAPLAVTPAEFGLLHLLALHAGMPVSRDLIARDVLQIRSRATPVDNVIEAAIYRLRGKLRDAGMPDALVTVRGRGYALQVNP